jgi:hypothetical protein
MNLNIISWGIFLTVLVVYLWYTFAIVYHLIRFGVGTNPKKIALIFFLGSFILFSLSIVTFIKIDWINILKNNVYF